MQYLQETSTPHSSKGFSTANYTFVLSLEFSIGFTPKFMSESRRETLYFAY